MSSKIPPLPPFDEETAQKKVKAAQDKWNTRNPKLISPAYTPDSIWRNRDKFFQGTEAIEAFLRNKWEVEHNYRLRKELFAFKENRIAVEFWYEYSETPDTSSQWYRTYGLEHWVFEEDGRMKSRQMSGNTIKISSDDRWFKDGVDVNEGQVPRGHISTDDAH
ncbi:response regulator receiver protein [Kwoniella heveanensis BCC8398]|uniref:Response regulator receiver protein n=1 Tax=Kwoniella heveanensis BCC8398 TaxID=1296120 RepID=A0A1B9GHP8_9TREE|nr:response regulator receiver protein [Kwoniella heveanensis BCC8398]